MNNRASTHTFARALLSRPDEFVRFWLFGKLSIVWDSGVPVSVPTEEILSEAQREMMYTYEGSQ